MKIAVLIILKTYNIEYVINSRLLYIPFAVLTKQNISAANRRVTLHLPSLLLTPLRHLDHFQETIDNSECDMVVDGPICLFNGQKIIVPDAVPPGLIGHWTFDDKKFLDFSGNKNHALNTVPVGAQRFGHGYSAMFNGENYVEIGHSDSLNVKEFSITFWIFLIQGRGQAPGKLFLYMNDTF